MLNNILLYNREGFPVSPGCAMFRTKDILAGFIVDIPNDDGLDSKKNGAGNIRSSPIRGEKTGINYQPILSTRQRSEGSFIPPIP